VGTKISSWEHLGLHTTALTTLHLPIGRASPTPTMSQLLSILASNPRLRSLTLSESMIPRDSGDGSASRAPLHHLRYLSLDGNFHLVFRLLRRLDHPETMGESIRLNLFYSTVGEVSEILGPYVRDHLRRDERSQDQLGIFINSNEAFLSVEVSTVNTANGSTQKVTFATFAAVLLETVPPPVKDKLCIDFVACIPRDRVVCFGGKLNLDAVKGMVPAMPKIRELHLVGAPMLFDGFLQPDPDGPLANTKLLPSLRRLHLEQIVLRDNNWTPLLSYLAHQTSGGQVISLSLSGERAHICKGVVEDIMGLVENFMFALTMDKDCSCGFCSVDGGGGEWSAAEHCDPSWM
jgi:hypothetical protein